LVPENSHSEECFCGLSTTTQGMGQWVALRIKVTWDAHIVALN
jgi:hypothetical protein